MRPQIWKIKCQFQSILKPVEIGEPLLPSWESSPHYHISVSGASKVCLFPCRSARIKVARLINFPAHLPLSFNIFFHSPSLFLSLLGSRGPIFCIQYEKVSSGVNHFFYLNVNFCMVILFGIYFVFIEIWNALIIQVKTSKE